MKDEFIKLFTENIHRDGADKLLEWIQKTDFFTAPASTKYHNCHEGGLCEHSVNVFNRFKLNVSDYCEHDSEYMEKHSELIAVCALLHDLCKANFYTVSMRNVKNESGQWEKQPYYSVDEKFPFGHGEKSVFLIERFMKLTAEEAVAIRFHMGEFEKDRSTSDAYAKFPLALMLHIADLEATYLDERMA